MIRERARRGLSSYTTLIIFVGMGRARTSWVPTEEAETPLPCLRHAAVSADACKASAVNEAGTMITMLRQGNQSSEKLTNALPIGTQQKRHSNPLLPNSSPTVFSII